MSTIIVNCGEIAHLSVGDISEPISGYEMLDKKSLVFPKGNAILIKNGKIRKTKQEKFQIFSLGGSCGLNTYILYQFLCVSAILQQHGISRTSLRTTVVRRDNPFRTTKTESISSLSFLALFRVITAVCCVRSGVEREETGGVIVQQARC